MRWRDALRHCFSGILVSRLLILYESTFPHCHLRSIEYLWRGTKNKAKDERRINNQLRIRSEELSAEWQRALDGAVLRGVGQTQCVHVFYHRELQDDEAECGGLSEGTFPSTANSEKW